MCIPTVSWGFGTCGDNKEDGEKERKKERKKGGFFFSSFQSFRAASPILDVDVLDNENSLEAITIAMAIILMPYHHVQPTVSNNVDNPYVQISCSPVVNVSVHACII